MSPAQFESLKGDRDLLVAAHHAEECYDHILENYCEFSLELMQMCIRHSLLSHHEKYLFEDIRRIMNRRFMNVMTSTRKYIDTVSNAGQVVTGDNNVKGEICHFLSEQYDARLAYRAMDYLRNAAQHSEQPISGATLQSKWLEPFEDNSRGEHAIGVTLNLDELRPKKEKHRRVVRELRERSSKIDIRGLMDEYLEVIGEIHDKYRSLVKGHLETLEGRYMSPIVDLFPDSYADVTGRAIKYDESSAVREEFSIFAELVGYRRHLENKNGKLANLSRRYVTSKSATAA